VNDNLFMISDKKKEPACHSRESREIIGVERNYNASTHIIPTERLEVNLAETLFEIKRVEIQDTYFLQGQFLRHLSLENGQIVK
jgi:hypothetical protein